MYIVQLNYIIALLPFLHVSSNAQREILTDYYGTTISGLREDKISQQYTFGTNKTIFYKYDNLEVLNLTCSTRWDGDGTISLELKSSTLELKTLNSVMLKGDTLISYTSVTLRVADNCGVLEFQRKNEEKIQEEVVIVFISDNDNVSPQVIEANDTSKTKSVDFECINSEMNRPAEQRTMEYSYNRTAWIEVTFGIVAVITTVVVVYFCYRCQKRKEKAENREPKVYNRIMLLPPQRDDDSTCYEYSYVYSWRKNTVLGSVAGDADAGAPSTRSRRGSNGNNFYETMDVHLPASSVRLPVGNAHLLRSTVQLPAGSVQLPPGRVQLPASSVQIPVGSVHLPTGNVQLKAGSGQLPFPNVQLPAGSVQIPPGSVHLPTGTVQLPA